MFRVELPMRMAGDPAHETAALKANSDYWWEGYAYEITQDQAQKLRDAATSIMACFNEAMDYVVSTPAVLRKFHFGADQAKNRAIQTLAAESWKDPSQRGYVMDRWDMAWDGVNPPKLLERNFGYLGLVESTGVVQEDYIKWLRTNPGYGDVSSFGNLQDHFMRAFREVATMRGVSAGSAIDLIVEADTGSADKGMIETGHLLAKWMQLSGFKTAKVAEAVWQCRPDRFATPEAAKNFSETLLGNLRKNGCEADDGIIVTVIGSFGTQTSKISPKGDATATYPFYDTKEFHEGTGGYRSDYRGTILQPAWVRLMEHKSMLPILHQRFPDNPHILAAVDGCRVVNDQISFAKLVNGCQGFGARVLAPNGKVLSKRRGFENSKRSKNYITQAYCDAVENPDRSHKVVHLFTTNGRPAAIGTREAAFSFVGGTGTSTKYVPVIVRPQASTDQSVASYEIFDDHYPFAERIHRSPVNFAALKHVVDRVP